MSQSRSIKIHPAGDFEGMRRAGHLAASTLDFLVPHVKPGVSTGELDQMADDFINENGGVSACIGYRGYPKSVCISPNHVVCHGIPGELLLREGDIINIDVTVIVDGWHGDTSRMFPVGSISGKARRLVEITHESMMAGIQAIKPGAGLRDIGAAIQGLVEPRGYSVVRDFCGHGIGQVFHDEPNVLHYANHGRKVTLEEGMFFTVEPMINAGGHHVRVLEDQWTAVTVDASLSAQFEHTIGITADGVEIFTLSPAGLHHPPYEA